MKISVDAITEVPKDLSFSEEIDDLNLIYKESEVRDFNFPPFLDVKLVFYRSGRDIFFSGRLGTTLHGHCSRCLKSYPFSLEKAFDFILTPEPLPAKSKELNRDEMGLSFYSGEEINLSPFIREQVLLALPMRPLCDEQCRGLCVGCGTNLNHEACRCPSAAGDPRVALFRSLKLDQ